MILHLYLVSAFCRVSQERIERLEGTTLNMQKLLGPDGQAQQADFFPAWDDGMRGWGLGPCKSSRVPFLGWKSLQIYENFVRGERSHIFASFLANSSQRIENQRKSEKIIPEIHVSRWLTLPQLTEPWFFPPLTSAGDSGPRSFSRHHLRCTSPAAVSTISALLGRWGMEHVSMGDVLFFEMGIPK